MSGVLGLALVPWIAPSAPGLPQSQGQGSGRGSTATATTTAGRAASTFSWASSTQDLGSVSFSATEGANWRDVLAGIRYQRVPSYTGDPTFELIFGPPFSGHPDRAERVLFQMPSDFKQKPVEDRVLVIGFHSFSVSEKQIFQSTDLPEICAERGWALLAPYGLTDTNFANVDSQKSLEAVLDFFHPLVEYNRQRVYSVGFSMGALNALSFAMRHQDPEDVRIAGVVFHTGPVDLIRQYNDAPLDLQLLLGDDDHFGATPDDDLFAYDRVTPVRLLPNGVVYQDRAPVVNSLHIPIYIHANLADPDERLVAEVLELKEFLQMRGADVHEDLAFDPIAGHTWDTLDLRAAMDVLQQNELDEPPAAYEVFADATGSWLTSEVRTKTPDIHAHYSVEVSPDNLWIPNSVAVRNLRDAPQLALDLELMGLDPTQLLSLSLGSRDGALTTLYLKGYENPPSGLFATGLMLASWGHNPQTKEVRLLILPGNQEGVIDILP